MKRVTEWAVMMLGFWRSNSSYKKYKKIGPSGMLNESDQPTQFEHFSHLDTPYQQ
jgi:hypothetical protein